MEAARLREPGGVEKLFCGKIAKIKLCQNGMAVFPVPVLFQKSARKPLAVFNVPVVSE
jgi:hypothetical protein